jgi:hypothetical protein
MRQSPGVSPSGKSHQGPTSVHNNIEYMYHRIHWTNNIESSDLLIIMLGLVLGYIALLDSGKKCIFSSMDLSLLSRDKAESSGGFTRDIDKLLIRNGKILEVLESKEKGVERQPDITQHFAGKPSRILEAIHILIAATHARRVRTVIPIVWV